MAMMLRRLIIVLAVFALPGRAAELAVEHRIQAVNDSAKTAAACRRLPNFYWEIGDAQKKWVGGAIGSRYFSDKELKIDSASLWLFGSYVLEQSRVYNKKLEPQQLQALTMNSGYTALKPHACLLANSVADCLRSADRQTPEHVGKFFFNDGHAQKLAGDLGLGNFNAAQLGAEYRNYLGRDLDIDFNVPQLASGVSISPAGYGKFLQKILAGKLRMANYLGSNPLCTLPDNCPDAVHSPIAVAWHYSLSHWVEDDPQGDGAFSSAGALGFYPWISADKRWYGILARENLQAQASQESVACGQLLRKAWLTGNAQH